jgi:imidazole glycerol-phosphate synthase subunit HisH
MIAIVDYGMGNVRSVMNALAWIGEDAEVTSDARKLDDADRLILPGVGAFGDAIDNLRRRELVEALERQVKEKGKPFLAICLGLQLLARSSTEHGAHEGLGWLDADVVRFDLGETALKIPHMGWNDVAPDQEHALFKGLRREQFVFYFVHSFHIVCRDTADVAATCTYGRPFTAAVGRGNVFATQFHPEKSQDSGLQILTNFASWKP